jgi:iron-sulfur cluster repair protein YtfE (RIC family)
MSEIKTKEDMEVYLSSLIHTINDLYHENIDEDAKKIELIKFAHEVMRVAATA